MPKLVSSCSADGLWTAAKVGIAQNCTSQDIIDLRYMCHSPSIMDRPEAQSRHYFPFPDKPRPRRRRTPYGGKFDGRCSRRRINAYRTVRHLRGDLEVVMAGAPAQSEPGVIQLTLNRRSWRSPGTVRIGFSRWNL